jgi:Fungal N-terminal domain of STAND proteins
MDGIGTGLAIAGAIMTAGKVIKQIKDFVTDSRTVDESVKGFLNEVEALQSVLEAIKDSFANIGSLAEERESIRKLWNSVDTTIEDCQHSLGKLRLIFRRLGKQAGNGYQAIVKQLKVKSKADDIANIRRQIISYNITFQTAITSITL